MFVLGLYLHVLMGMCICLGAHGELTADLVFSMLNSRLKTLEIFTFSLDASVKRINERLDNIELLSDTQLQVNDNNVADSREGYLRSDSKNMNRKMMKALASEKKFINNALSEYEGKFTEFQKTVKDQMDIMNKSSEASSLRLEKTIMENEANMNSSFHQFTVDSETMLQDAMFQFEAAITNASIEHEAAVSEIKEHEKSITDIKEDMNAQLNRINSVDSRVSSLHNSQSRDISSVRSRVSSVEGKLRTLDNEVSSQHRSQASDISSVRSRVSSLEDKHIGFTARLSKHLSNYAKNKIIVFDNVLTNHGGAYSRSTGKFTAPRSGLYLFQFNVEAYGSKKAHVVLYVDVYFKASSNVINGPNLTGSNAAVAYMYKGDEAYVKTAPFDSSYGIYGYRTTFTGVLIN